MVNVAFMWHAGEECRAPAEAGPCRASIQMFYFNTETGQCEEFIYGGCEGNANRYDSVEECQQACSADKRRNKQP